MSSIEVLNNKIKKTGKKYKEIDEIYECRMCQDSDESAIKKMDKKFNKVFNKLTKKVHQFDAELEECLKRLEYLEQIKYSH